MKKELINIGQSLNLTTGELSTLNKHKNVFAGNMIIRGSSENDTNKFLKHLLNQFLDKDNLDIYYIDCQESADFINFSTINNLKICFNNEDLLKIKESKDKNIFYLKTQFSESFYNDILDHLIKKTEKIKEKSDIKETIVFIPSFDIFNFESLITLFNKAGGLGFKFILTTNSFENHYLENKSFVEDNINNHIYFKCSNISEKQEINFIGNKETLNFMKLKNLPKRHFLYIHNQEINYCLSPFVK